MFNRNSITTQKDIAEACLVSRATVGAILAGGKAATRYNEETRRRVLAAAKELRYRPHRAAQLMRRSQSNLIGIIHFGAGLEAADKANMLLAQELNAAGFDYVAMDMNWQGGGVERAIEELVQARVEGVLISHIQEVLEDRHIEILLRAGIPVVSINGERRKNVSHIFDNVSKAFFQLTSHLLAQGHRRILQILPQVGEEAYRSSLRAWGERKNGFATAISTLGRWKEAAEVSFSMNLFEGEEILGVTMYQNPRAYEMLKRPVYHFCKRLCASGFRPDALVCSNDAYAIEAIMAALEMGLSIPEDLAVTGYDNDRIGEFPILGITTAEQDLKGICAAGVQTLIKHRENPSLPATTQTFDSELILRTSCGRTTPLLA